MTDRELMQQALEALEEMGGGYSQNLIAALRERLAQPEWVGLTDEDKQTAVWTNGTFGAGALWAEAKLREKNT